MIIYKILNIINNKMYVGQTINGIERWQEHKRKLNRNAHPNAYLQSAWNKHGSNSFEFQIIQHCSTLDELNEAEIATISKYNSTDRSIGYNLSCGGNNFSHSEETKKKMSLSKTGFKHSEETKKKISKNSSRHMLGKRHSEETKKKIGLAAVGRIKSPETISKLRESLKNSSNPHHIKGIPKSNDQKKKISEGLTKKWDDDEFKKKMQQSRKKQATAENIAKIINSRRENGNCSNHAKSWPDFVSPEGIIFSNIKNMSEFAKLHGVNSIKMRQVAHGNRKSHKGWKLATSDMVQTGTQI